MAKITGVIGNIVQSNAYLEDTNEDLRKHYLELHALATRQRKRILELEELLGEALFVITAPWKEEQTELQASIRAALKEESDG